MKKFLIIAVICLSAFTLQAQTLRAFLSSNAVALIKTVDTVTNTGAKSMTLPLALGGPRQTTVVSAVCNLLTGTGAGTVILQGSIDGVNYATIAATQLQGSQTATFTLTNVANQSYNFVLPNCAFRFFKVTLTGSGTETITIAATVYCVSNS